MTLAFSVEKFGPEFVEAYSRMFQGPDEEKGIDLLCWRFERNPHGMGYLATARDDGRICGFIGLIPCKFGGSAGEALGLHAVDTIVDPAYRGQGLFTRMGQAIYDNRSVHGADMVWGFPNDQAARGWFGRLGWRHFGTVPFLVKPLRTGFFLRRLNSLLGKIDVPVSLASGPNDLAVEQVERMDERIDRLATDSIAENPFGRKRDAAWLAWRLLDCPFQNYRNVAVFDGDRCLAFVSTVVLEKHGAKICYVMEAMARSQDGKTLQKLLTAEIARARSSGAEVALAWCSRKASNRAALGKVGFYHFPDRIRPVDLFFGARAIEPSAIPCENGQSWYISYLDSDTV